MTFISKVFHLLAPPVFKDDEEKSRLARTLNFILVIVMIILLSFIIPAPFIGTDISRILIQIILLSWTLGMLITLRRGYVREAAFFLTLTLWLVVSFGTYQTAGFRGSIMASYYGIVLIACLVMNMRVGAVFAFLSVAFTGWLVYAEANGLLPPQPEPASFTSFWSEFSSVMVFIVAAAALLTSDLRKALEITRRNEKELQEAAIQATLLADKAEQANRFKDGLIHRITHELRAPLSVIMPLAEMLRENYYGELTEPQTDVVKRISSNSIRLEKLIKELLDRSQIESGRLQLHLADFSPAEMARSLYTDCQTLAEKQEIGLKLEIDADLPETLLGDQERTEEILRNLVVNAIKYTEKGQVVMRIQNVDADHWGFQVEDTGVGISKEDQQYIFEPFRQVGDTKKRRRGGVGLGLSIVQYLVVEAMSGTITLESEPGVGSIFTVVLPKKIPNTDSPS